jgi:ParB family chromosome partitioning protein
MELAAHSNDSKTQIQRYIRLTYLIKPLLDMVDEGQIALRPAVELSYLREQEQQDLLETISYEDATPSLAQAIKLKNLSRSGNLNPDSMLAIMCEKKANQAEKISFRTDLLRQYLPKNVTQKQTEAYILQALEYYRKHHT